MEAGEGATPDLNGGVKKALGKCPFLPRGHPAESVPLGGVEGLEGDAFHRRRM